MSAEAFLTLHRNLPREGPGEAADVAWLGQQVELPEGALIADLGCGPGADIGALLELAPGANVVAVDHHLQFLGQASELWETDERVEIRLADMREPGGKFDLIWCAGAVYFLGVTEALDGWRKFLKPGGIIAFSEPCFWTDEPSPAVRGIWSGYAGMGNENSLETRIDAAGFETIANRRLSDAAWSDYFGPLLERMAELRTNADEDLMRVLGEEAAEIAAWDQYGDEFGYLLSVVQTG